MGNSGISVGAIRHQLAFTGQVRVAFTELVEATGDNDRRQAAEHHHRQHAAERHALIHMQQGGIADRERDRPFPDAARHDRQNDKEEDLERLEAQRQPNTHADNHADDFTAQHREEDAQEALDQHGAVHTHDAADDNAADIEVENIGGFIEFGRGLNHHVRQQAVIDQRGRDKGGANCRRTELADNRQAFAEFTAGKAEEGQRGHHDHNVARQFSAQAINRNQRTRQNEQRQRNNADFPGIHNMPPALFERWPLNINRVVGNRE
ncbi:Uncharacterised protein [Enterobacter cloacae]|nr:Uncharacterised protein [Enterobacter cloacae]